MDRWLLVIAVLLLVVMAAPAEGGAKVLDGTVRVEWHPDVLSLWPGQSGDVALTVENTGDAPVRVALVHVGLECPGGSSAVITPDYLELDAHEAARVTMSVTTHPTFVQSPCTSDSTVNVFWGQNLTLYGDSPGQVNKSTADGRSTFIIEVRDVPPFGWSSIVAAVASVAVVAFVLRRRAKRKGRATSKDAPSAGATPPSR